MCKLELARKTEEDFKERKKKGYGDSQEDVDGAHIKRFLQTKKCNIQI